jgi:hypothetical protein
MKTDCVLHHAAATENRGLSAERAFFIGLTVKKHQTAAIYDKCPDVRYAQRCSEG